VSPHAKARTHTGLAVILLTTAVYALPTMPLAAITGLAAATICGGFAAGYRHDARRAARAARPGPAPDDVTLTTAEHDAWTQITHHLQEQP
jgi:hypothetical protein